MHFGLGYILHVTKLRTKCCETTPTWSSLFNTNHLFLALLDYVSRGHEIEIRPLSVVRPSSVRPPVRLWHRLSLKLLHGFLFKF